MWCLRVVRRAWAAARSTCGEGVLLWVVNGGKGACSGQSFSGLFRVCPLCDLLPGTVVSFEIRVQHLLSPFPLSYKHLKRRGENKTNSRKHLFLGVNLIYLKPQLIICLSQDLRGGSTVKMGRGRHPLILKMRARPSAGALRPF